MKRASTLNSTTGADKDCAHIYDEHGLCFECDKEVSVVEKEKHDN